MGREKKKDRKKENPAVYWAGERPNGKCVVTGSQGKDCEPRQEVCVGVVNSTNDSNQPHADSHMYNLFLLIVKLLQ